MGQRGGAVALAAPLLLLVLASAAPAAQDRSSIGQVFVWAEELRLQELLDACIEFLDLTIDYDPQLVQDIVTLRSPPGMAPQELWEATNRLLLERDLVSVQSSDSDALSIVALENAPRHARVEPGPPGSALAGYIKYLHYVPDGRGEDVSDAMTAILNRQGAVTVPYTGTDFLLIQGPRPAVLDALDVLSVLEAGPAETVLEEYSVERLSPAALAALLEQVTQKQKTAGGPELRGSVLASSYTESVFLIAPETDLPRWRELARRLDRADGVITRTYAPNRFGLKPTAELVRKVFQGADGSLRIIEDNLTGTLIITAPPAIHEEVNELVIRLEDTPWTASRTLRSIPVEHRDADELLELLQDLLSDGPPSPRVLVPEAGPDAETPAPGRTSIAELPWENVSLSLDKGTNRLLAFGDIRLLDELESLVEALDVPHPQVMIEALVVALNESELRDIGVELRRGGDVGSAMGELSSLFGLGSPTLDETTLASPQGSGLTGVALDPGSFSALLRAIETVSEGRSVNLPRVLVSNHATGGLDSLLQTPYLSTNATNTVATTSLGGTLDAGTSISVTPHITDGWRLRLEVTVSVSAFVGEAADPALPPPRQENRLETEVSLPDGHTAVVGGLEVESSSEGESRVPILGRLPLIGALFRSTSTSDQGSRLFVFLRCNVIRRQGFEDLRYLSEEAMREADLAEDWPVLEPRIIR